MASESALRQGVNILSYILWFIFTMAGIGKLVKLSPVYSEMVRASKDWVSALYLDRIGMDAVTLRVLIGVSEIFLALILLTPKAMLAAYTLEFVMICAAFTHIRLKESPVPPLFVLALLLALTAARSMHAKAVHAQREAKKS